MNFAVILLAALVIFGGVALTIYYLKRRPADYSARDEALSATMEFVWVGILGQSTNTAPHITWVDGDRLDCHDDEGWISDEGCVAGLSWRDTNVCAVAWPRGTKKYSQTAFGHEVTHAFRWRVGTPDPNHTGPDFQPGGLVDQINAALRAAGR